MIPISKPFLGHEEKEAVIELMNSGMIAQGEKTAEFEKAFAKTVGTNHAVATSSGTAALHMALLAHQIGPGDEVITSPFTFIASVNSILFTGATPVFADVEEDSFNLSPASIEKAITKKTKAIMPVHLFGQACDMTGMMHLSAKYNLKVIEDCAQSIGAYHSGKMTGSFGTGCFSFYATKNITSGEGGMITTDSDEVAELARLIRAHGSRQKYYHDMLGFNFRMTDLQAAIGLVQLRKLGEITKKRRENASFFRQRIVSAKNPKIVNTEDEAAGQTTHVFHQYTLRLLGASGEERNKVVSSLSDQGISCGIFYPLPAHKQKHLMDLGLKACAPCAETLSNEVFSVPVHPLLTKKNLEDIVDRINDLRLSSRAQI